MVKSNRVACAFVLALSFTLLSFYPPVYWRIIGWWAGEAFYQGRPTSYWAEQIRKGNNWYDSSTEPFKPWEDLAKWFGYDPESHRWDHVGAFRIDPADVQSVVPPESVSVLVELLGREKDEGGLFAADRLWVSCSEENPRKVAEVAEAVRGAVPKIVAVMRSPSCRDRRWAVSVLGGIGQPAESAVPALIEILEQADLSQEKDVYQMAGVLMPLGEIGPGAREAIPLLVKFRDGEAGKVTIETRKGKIPLRSYAIEVMENIERKTSVEGKLIP